MPLVRLHRLLSSGAVNGVAANWIDHGSAGRIRPCSLGCRDWFLGAMDSKVTGSNLIDSARVSRSLLINAETVQVGTRRCHCYFLFQSTTAITRITAPTKRRNGTNTAPPQ